jgi:hypothetical protein
MTPPYSPSQIQRVLLQFYNLKKLSDRNTTRNCDRGKCSTAINTAITIAIIIASSEDGRFPLASTRCRHVTRNRDWAVEEAVPYVTPVLNRPVGTRMKTG